jgi:hypothetical protein
MFSLSDIQRTQYVPQVVSIPEIPGNLPVIAANSGPSKQVDVSTQVRVFSNFSKYKTANDEIQQAGDTATIYSSGFRLDYLDGLKNLPEGQACLLLESSRKLVTSYVGNAVVPIVDPPNIIFCQGPTTRQITQISLCQ